MYFEANIPFRLFLQNQSNVKNSFNSNLRNEATPAIVILFSTECILFLYDRLIVLLTRASFLGGFSKTDLTPTN